MSTTPKAILFDVDGVLIITPKLYSHQHAEDYSIEASQIEPFFSGEFRQATIGQADLKKLLEKHRGLWAWEGPVEDLMDRWFKAESNVDQKLMGIIKQLRGEGVKCYIATDQEQYRAAYLRDLFKGTMDGMIVSCEIGLIKEDPKFFEVALNKLRVSLPDLKASEVMFFDDSRAKVKAAAKTGIKAAYYTNLDQIASLVPAAARDPS